MGSTSTWPSDARAEPHPLQQIGDVVLVVRKPLAHHPQRQRYVFPSREVVEQPEILKHDADSPPHLRLAGRRQSAYVLIEDVELSSDTSEAYAIMEYLDHVHIEEVDFVREVNRLFPDGVSAVFDGVGKDTFLPSLECLDPFGTLVNFGNASGAPPPLDIRLLGARGSQMVTRMGMGFFFKDRAIQAKAAEEIFDLMTKGILRAHVERTYPLREAAQAHRDLEGRRTMGSVVLMP